MLIWEKVVSDLDFLNSLSTIIVNDKNSTIRGIGAPALAPADVPGIPDHQLEVVVVVDRGGDISVILNELIRSDLAVLDATIESVQKSTFRNCQ